MIQSSGFLDQLHGRRRLGIKVHFGEDGNRTHLSPDYVRIAVETVSRKVADCQLIETSTLYRGKRAQAQSHVALAHEHGFTSQRVLAPIAILDGHQGEDYYEVPTGLESLPRARLARKLKHFPWILNLAHFKGHFVTGFGGVLKNLAMGLAAKSGKLAMHSRSRPAVDPRKCTSCGSCVDYCPHQAIAFIRDVAAIGRSCTGCAGCIAICPAGAIRIDWNEAAANVGRKVVEYAYAVLAGRRALHLNFLINVTPNCDCMGTVETPFMPDVGIFGSLDPVACEQAAFDRAQAGLRKLYPHLAPEQAIAYAEQLGLGSRSYELLELPA
ncbi:MAG: DUF362 domain-containing protein [candidate division WOR-3 bacterium]